MAYNEFLSDRIATQLKAKGIPFEAKKMMGGICYMVDDKMCLGVMKDELMLRLDPEKDTENLKLPATRQMDFTGKIMKGYILVNPEGTAVDQVLSLWLDKALEFNPKSKSSKKK